MTFLPIVARELRVASRRPGTYWSRAVMAVLTIIAGVIIYADSRGEATHELGTKMFAVLCVMAYIYCLVTGISLTADCLSEEKREGTLGLLFLTDLKGYDVVGGKLVATSLNSFFGLLAILPVLAIPLLMGGVTNAEFGRAALVLVNTFLFSLSIGMFMSSISTSPRKAMAATLILILVYVLGLPACLAWVPFMYQSHEWGFALELINPSTAFAKLGEVEYAASPRNFWWPTGAVFGMSCIFLALASFIVPRTWQDNPPGVRVQRWRDKWRSWAFGETAERLAFRKRLLDINAFFWLAGRVRLKPAYVWTTLVGLACLWSWGAVENGIEWLGGFVCFLTMFILDSTLKIWVASESGRRLGEDRRAGALELLLSTPLSVEDILRGQMLALKRQFLGPMIVVLVAEGILLAAYLHVGHVDSDDMASAVSFGLASMVMLVADVVTLSYVAMWMSLTAKNPLRTTGAAVRRVLVLPWAIIGVTCIVAGFFDRILGQSMMTWKSFLALYVMTGLVIDVLFGVSAWRRLHKEFREVATRRFEVKRPLWKRLFGGRPQPPD